MTQLHSSLEALRMFLSVDYQCSYLAERLSCNIVADPIATDNHLYTQLAGFGFRRSGETIYRPHCVGCVACRSLRIPAALFQANRIQRRIWERNQDLQLRIIPAAFYREHFELFARYIKLRHAGGGMDPATPDSYWSFINSGWCNTVLYELRLQRDLIAVAVVDKLGDGLSAVYTFFDPDQAPRSLGTYAILLEIVEAQRSGLKWVYLGYWVDNCAKMSYKRNFKPHQIFIVERNKWVAVGC